jgi:hypothetical protein
MDPYLFFYDFCKLADLRKLTKRFLYKKSEWARSDPNLGWSSASGPFARTRAQECAQHADDGAPAVSVTWRPNRYGGRQAVRSKVDRPSAIVSYLRLCRIEGRNPSYTGRSWGAHLGPQKVVGEVAGGRGGFNDPGSGLGVAPGGRGHRVYPRRDLQGRDNGGGSKVSCGHAMTQLDRSRREDSDDIKKSIRGGLNRLPSSLKACSTKNANLH